MSDEGVKHALISIDMGEVHECEVECLDDGCAR